MDVDSFMQRFCEVGAEAVLTYVKLSGEHVMAMPEYFMPAYILHGLRGLASASLESNFATLDRYNVDVRRRSNVERALDDLGELPGKLIGRRVDMVIYEGEHRGIPKDQQDPFALVEFKSGYLDAGREPNKPSDRDKLLLFLECIDTCRWGIVCGWTNDAHRIWQKSSSLPGTSDLWYEVPIQSGLGDAKLFFCARVFARRSDPGRIQEFLAAFQAGAP